VLRCHNLAGNLRGLPQLPLQILNSSRPRLEGVILKLSLGR
jgi:hypothetical protein